MARSHHSTHVRVDLTDVRRCAGELARWEEDLLLSDGAVRDDASGPLQDSMSAVRRAIDAGATLDDLHEAVEPMAGPFRRRWAAATLAADCAALAFLEDALIVSAEGESPAFRRGRTRMVLGTARRRFDASVRRALLSGVPVEEIVASARQAGLHMASLDVVLAFQAARRT